MKRKLKQLFPKKGTGAYLALTVLAIALLAMASDPSSKMAFAAGLEGPIVMQERKFPPPPPPPSPSSTSTAALASTAPTLQRCKGPQRFIAPKETFNLTCDVVSPLGGSKMLVLPEIWVPGNGCITTVDKPHVVMVGNNFGVSATFTNRCGSGYMGSEGGLAWLIYQMLEPQQAQPQTATPPPLPPPSSTSTAALASTTPTLQRCKGPQRFIAPKETFNLTCDVVSPLGGSKMLVLPEIWVPGNGCITTVDKPHVVMVGNNIGVSATFTNRCGSGYMGSEGGLAWLIYQMQ